MNNINELLYDEYVDVVEKVSRKYQSVWLEREFIQQELWESILKMHSGSDKLLDKPLVAKSCYNKAVDLYRYNRRRYDSKSEYFENDDSQSFSKLPKVSNSESLAVKDYINLFPKNSKERIFLLVKSYLLGVIDSDISPELESEYNELISKMTDNELSDFESAKNPHCDNSIAKYFLKYCGGKTPSFMKIKRRVQSDIMKYINE